MYVRVYVYVHGLVCMCVIMCVCVYVCVWRVLLSDQVSLHLSVLLSTPTGLYTWFQKGTFQRKNFRLVPISYPAMCLEFPSRDMNFKFLLPCPPPQRDLAVVKSYIPISGLRKRCPLYVDAALVSISEICHASPFFPLDIVTRSSSVNSCRLSPLLSWIGLTRSIVWVLGVLHVSSVPFCIAAWVAITAPSIAPHNLATLWPVFNKPHSGLCPCSPHWYPWGRYSAHPFSRGGDWGRKELARAPTAGEQERQDSKHCVLLA